MSAHAAAGSGALPRVFFSCHNPSVSGEIKWDGYEIVGYVDVTPAKKQPSVGVYYQGWESIPASLNGTIDIVFGVFCPVGGDLMSGSIKRLDVYPMVNQATGQEIVIGGKPVLAGKMMNEVFVRAFELLKPGGHLFFPNIPTIPADTQALLETKLPPPPAGKSSNPIKNSVEIVEPDAPFPQRLGKDGELSPIFASGRTASLRITKPKAVGGRPTKTKRRAQKKKRTLRRR